MVARHRSSGSFWSCTGYPECDVRQSAGDDGLPVGTPGNKETRQARIEAHDALDAIWRDCLGVYQSGSQPADPGRLMQIARSRTYSWLADRMIMDRKDCHVAQFDVFHCGLVVAICKGVTYEDVRAWSRQRSRKRKVEKVKKKHGSEQIEIENTGAQNAKQTAGDTEGVRSRSPETGGVLDRESDKDV